MAPHAPDHPSAGHGRAAGGGSPTHPSPDAVQSPACASAWAGRTAGADRNGGFRDPIFADLFKHNIWANLRLLDACAGLTDAQMAAAVPGTFGQLGATLVHLVAAEESYVARLAEADRPDRSWAEGPFPGVAVLRERARRSGEALLGATAREQAGRILRGTWRGEPYAIPATTILIQTINHATEHRAHVATILSQLGIEPPEMDGWTYGVETAPEPADTR